ncbi:MAG: hypothetical protein Q8N70_12785, partial [Deltaproteobacteria bacterium]|nr:hypothetical protein [Deltaproteobacteria bacterium]
NGRRVNYIEGFRSWFDMACPLRARGSPSGAEAPLGRSLSRRLSKPFVPSRASPARPGPGRAG